MKRLLLLHPSAEVRKAVEHTLSRLGVEMDIALAPADALVQLKDAEHGVVVLDHVLAGTDLPDILAALHQPQKPRPTVIVTSAGADEYDAGVVSLVVPAAYDVSTLVGVILGCVTDSLSAPIFDRTPASRLF
jgi:DNA-binding NtrC family response regulator